MKVKELIARLSQEDPEAEMLVSVNLKLNREDPKQGVLILPTATVETGRFHTYHGPKPNQRWVSVVATDAYGVYIA